MSSSNAPRRAAHRDEWREDDFVLADLATFQGTATIFLTPKSPLARALRGDISGTFNAATR
jgi:hypothetical protein